MLHLKFDFKTDKLNNHGFVAAFLFYAALVITAVFILIFHFIPQYGQTHIMVYIGVCSLVGSLSVCLYTFLVTMTSMEFFFLKLLPYDTLSCICCAPTGHECQSTWNCVEANINGDESANISPNVVLYYSCRYLCDYPDELSKQGNGSFLFLSFCFPYLFSSFSLFLKFSSVILT